MDAVALQLLLGRTPGLSAPLLRTVLDRAGALAEGVMGLAALVGERPPLLRSLGLAARTSAWLRAPDAALLEADRRWAEREGIELLDALGALYPPQLSQLEGAPALLYVQGEAACLSRPQLAIVGTRNPTVPGRYTAMEFAMSLAHAGLAITSGLARGIDAAGHEGALSAGGATIAVLGAGLDRIYPPEHAPLAARIAAQGALVSEFPRDSRPRSANFPRRNRIISGLSLGTLVVEAAHHSGSLITARLALEQGRRVFAIPGSIHNPLARGCHALIRSGARLVETTADIFDEIAISVGKQGCSSGGGDADRVTAAARQLDKGSKILLDALGFESASVNTLVERTGIPTQSVASMLLILELVGAVGSQAGGHYVRL
ncbi:MAG TPA: DNA-processing protein DprA [Steroidobacteraceae bacterium]